MLGINMYKQKKSIMRKASFIILLLIGFGGYTQIPSDYYTSCENKVGDDLKKSLHDIIKDHTVYEYTEDTTDVWDILKETDRDPNNPDNVVCVYSGITKLAKDEYNNRSGWEREHTWSASHGPFKRKKTPGTDVHHLKPVHAYFNGVSGKWARDFDECTKPVLYKEEDYDCYKEKDAFEPRDAVKGDVARMLFYMAVRYEGDDGYPDLELVDHIKSKQHPKRLPYYGKLSVLIEWHKDDPVDEFEKNRNEVIYSYQGNRNPFIDHPEFVNLIWE